MVEFEFRVTQKNGAVFTYSFRAQDKLAAYSIMKKRFPDADYKKLKP